MMARFCVILCIASLLQAGCRRRGPYMDAYLDLLDAEKRALEDQVYSYQAKYEQTQAELEALRKELARLRQGENGGSDSLQDLEVSPDSQRPQASPPDIPELSPPTVDPGTPSTKPPNQSATPPLDPRPQPARRDSSAPPSILPLPSAAETAEEIQTGLTPSPSALGSDPDHIVLNHRFTRGKNLDDAPGDDGLTVVIEPRTADGHPLPQFGPVSVVLLDPSLIGAEARFAHWNFTADEVRAAMIERGQSREIHLEMKWPHPPKHNKLHLFVRLETEQGQRLEANRILYIELPSPGFAGWTPRPSKSPSPPKVNVATRPGTSVLQRSPSATPAPPAGQPTPAWSPTRPAPR